MSKRTVEVTSGHRNEVWHWLAVGMCGTLAGAAVLLSLGSVAQRWFSLASSQMPLALIGGLAGASVVLVALALSPSAGETEHALEPALVWSATSSVLVVPMTWMPAPVLPARGSARLAAHTRGGRWSNAAARRCAMRRYRVRSPMRRIVAQARAVPPTEA
ncbi:MAG: hypothetical protein ACRDHP_15725 [Ktedonobacterales bacterium]